MSYSADDYLEHLGIDYDSTELAHYGVKGMKWGVRKEDDLVGRLKAKPGDDKAEVKRFNDATKKIREQIKQPRVNGVDVQAEALRAKYGPPEEEKKGLSKGAKVAIGVGIGVAVVGAIGAVAYSRMDPDTKAAIAKAISQENKQKDINNKLLGELAKNPAGHSLWNTRGKAYAEAVDGIDINWDKGVDLSPGSLLKRISSVAETEARPGGFYAAFRDEDVESYKAILPSFWPQWGKASPTDGGFINNYQAKTGVKAPSGKETVEMFKDLLRDNDAFRQTHWIARENVDLLPDVEVKSLLKQSSLMWADDNNEATRIFFGEAKKRGFNALIDFNDAGTLGKTPLRVLDGSLFDIIGADNLSFSDMIDAAEKWLPSLVHYFKEGAALMSNAADEYLSHLGIEIDEDIKQDVIEHHGVKGMRWGVRRSDDQLARANGSSRAEKKAAKVKAKADKKAAAAKEDQEIAEARLRQGERANDLEKQAFRTYAANGEAALKRAMNKYDKMETELFENPDAEIANKMTSGEKRAAAIDMTISLGILLAGATVAGTTLAKGRI